MNIQAPQELPKQPDEVEAFYDDLRETIATHVPRYTGFGTQIVNGRLIISVELGEDGQRKMGLANKSWGEVYQWPDNTESTTAYERFLEESFA